jgi:proline iminopeptidase
MLDGGDGNRIYWEVCGNPHGKPAVVLHGGPGSGCSTGIRRYFDPSAYRIVLFDQRGCGRSTPHASEPGIDLSANTTEHLLGDIERLRQHLGIDRWLVYGGSWGSTLALAYAERNPHRVTGMVLAGVTTTRRSEIDWLYHGLSRFFPDEWARFRDGVPEPERDGDLVEAYHRLLLDPDPAVCARAASDWCEWEMAIASLHPEHKRHPRYERPEFRLAFARIVTHYFRHNAWLEDGVLLREAGALAGIPGIMVHGRLDLEAPLVTAWALARAWPACELVVVGGAGHDARDPGMGDAVVAATDRFAAHRSLRAT